MPAAPAGRDMMTKPKKIKAVGWAARLCVGVIDAIVVVRAKTRKDAIRQIEEVTGVSLTIPSQVKRLAVMDARIAPDLPEWDWEEI
jgi:hypothetical protein